MVQDRLSGHRALAKADYGLAFDTGDEGVVNVRIQDAAGKSGEYQILVQEGGRRLKISASSELKSNDLTV